MRSFLRLAPGEFLGPARFRRECGGLLVALTRYLPAQNNPGMFTRTPATSSCLTASILTGHGTSTLHILS